MYSYINKRNTRGNQTSKEGRRCNLVDKELRQAVGEILSKHGFDPVRIITNITLQLCQDKKCSDCGLQGICNQGIFKDRVIGLNIIIQACDKGQ